jgi:lysophospholipase L1-like esterase
VQTDSCDRFAGLKLLRTDDSAWLVALMSPSVLRTALALAASLFMTACATRTSSPHANSMPVFTPGMRILFQGDSITDGNRGRSTDPNHILGHGYQFIIASQFGAQFAERQLVFLNRGISGHKVTDLEARWQKDTLDLQPGLLSILIGINDLNAGVSATDYEAHYDQLLARTVAALPGVKLVLCEPFGLPVGHFKTDWEKHRADLAERRAVVNRLGAKYHAPVVRFQAAFDRALERAPAEYWIWDGIHPTYSGHQLMADEWIRTVRVAWPEAKS